MPGALSLDIPGLVDRRGSKGTRQSQGNGEGAPRAAPEAAAVESRCISEIRILRNLVDHYIARREGNLAEKSLQSER
jgi:hypothetical protein